MSPREGRVVTSRRSPEAPVPILCCPLLRRPDASVSCLIYNDTLWNRCGPTADELI